MGHRHSYEALGMAAEYAIRAHTHQFRQINKCEDCFGAPAPFQIYFVRESGEQHISRPSHGPKYNKREYNQNAAEIRTEQCE